MIFQRVSSRAMHLSAAGTLTCLCLFTFIEFLVAEAGEDDPCYHGNHRVISDARRSISYTSGRYAPLLCDKGLISTGTWYRFIHSVGNTLPEACVPIDHCGTQAPIWINDTHPTVVGRTKKIQACANYGHMDDCCSWKADIYVRRCHGNRTDFYVYQLVEPPGCSMAYCAGHQLVCPSERYYNRHTDACEVLYPELGDISLSAPVVEGDMFAFYCTLHGVNNFYDDGARYYIEIMFDNMVLYTTMVAAPNRTVRIEERHFKRNMGKTLRCRVSAFWEGSLHRSPPVESTEYFVGIKLSKKYLLIKESSSLPAKVTLLSTVPPTCSSPSPRGECGIYIRVTAHARLRVSQGAERSCVYHIHKNTWNSAASVTEGVPPLEVAVRRDIFLNEALSYDVQFDIIDDVTGDKIWNGYKIPYITVNVTRDRKFGKCTVTSDPRIVTFDSKRYDVLAEVGEFILWRNEKRNFEAHVRLWVCRPEGPLEKMKPVSCACGVAVRDGNAHMYVDMCHTSYGLLPRPKIVQGHKGDLGDISLIRDPSGKSFMISLKSGTSISLDIHPWGMNVYSIAPSEDYNQTSGLCGTFDDNSDNDLYPKGGGQMEDVHSFVSSWRTQKKNSLFENINDGASDVIPRPGCDCSDDHVRKCDAMKPGDTSLWIKQPHSKVKPLLKYPQNLATRVRRDATSDDLEENPISGDLDSYTDDIDEEPAAEFDYGHAPLPPAPRNWPTPGGITEAIARAACNAALQDSPVFSICRRQVLQDRVWDPIDSCVDDIQIMDDLEWSHNSVREMEFSCMTSAMMNDEGQAQDLSDKMCSPDCGRHGKCTEGSCICDQGYEGSDCTIPVGNIPIAKYIPNRGLCNVMVRPCQKIRVIADGLLDSPDLSCKVQPVLMKETGEQEVQLNSTSITNATLVSATEVMCPIPAPPVRNISPLEGQGEVVHGAWIYLSNDGVKFSDGLFLTVFDSTCMTCQKDGICSKKADACLIDGHCFADGTPDPRNWCKICDSVESTRRFIRRHENNPPVFESPGKIVKLAGEELTLDLQAHDPDGLNVTFTVDFTTNPRVIVDSNGTLRWSSERDESVRLEVSVTDDCGTRTIQDLELSTIECKCAPNGECVIDPSRPRGQGYYYCVCDPGWAGELCTRDIVECASSPCLHGACVDMISGYSCVCHSGYQGDHCDEDNSTTVAMTTDMTTTVTSVFSDWGQWARCTKPCDYGLKTRRRWCRALPCQGKGSETRLCSQFNCPETPGEKNEGIVLVVIDTRIETIRLHENDVMMTLAEAFNRLYARDTGLCESVGLGMAPLAYPALVKEDFYYSGGYPKLLKDNLHVWKVIAMADVSNIRASCSGNITGSLRRKRSLDLSYLEPEVTKHAVETCRDKIYRLYGITIDKILLPENNGYITISVDTQYLINNPPQEVKQEMTSDLHLVVGMCVGTVIVVAVMILVTVLVMRKSNKSCLRGNSTSPTNSIRYLTKEDQLELNYGRESSSTLEKRKGVCSVPRRSSINFHNDHYVTLQPCEGQPDGSRSPSSLVRSLSGGDSRDRQEESMMHISSISSNELDLHVTLPTGDHMTESDVDDVFDSPREISQSPAIFPSNPLSEDTFFPGGVLRLSTRSTDRLIPDWK